MKVKFRAFYGEDDVPLLGWSASINIPQEDVDPDTFNEAADYVVEAMEDFDLDSIHDDDIGCGLLAFFEVPGSFETKREAKQALAELVEEANGILDELR